MNNKKIGNKFENETLEFLASKGFWVHFIVPDIRGAQPFDIIAAKDGLAYAIDCKTCVANTFNINRLEENQISSFNKWLKCGNLCPLIVVEHKHKVYVIRYDELQEKKSVNLENMEAWDGFITT